MRIDLSKPIRDSETGAEFRDKARQNDIETASFGAEAERLACGYKRHATY